MPTFNNRPNYTVTDAEGYTHWISRSVAVVVLPFFRLSNDDLYLPIVKRAGWLKHCPNQWALVSGFLDWGESGDECARREVWEETGLDLLAHDFKLRNQPDWIETIPNPTEEETISLRYVAYAEAQGLPLLKSKKHDVSGAMLVNVSQGVHEHYRPLAFNHEELIEWGMNFVPPF